MPKMTRKSGKTLRYMPQTDEFRKVQEEIVEFGWFSLDEIGEIEAVVAKNTALEILQVANAGYLEALLERQN